MGKPLHAIFHLFSFTRWHGTQKASSAHFNSTPSGPKYNFQIRILVVEYPVPRSTKHAMDRMDGPNMDSNDSGIA